MKISAYHKSLGDEVELIDIDVYTNEYYDKVYVSKVFGDEYSKMSDKTFNAKEIIYGGTGFAITIENEKEVYNKSKDLFLPKEIENIFPDYSLYSETTKNTAYGFLTRGCCNNCSFCLVTKKEGACSKRVAKLSDFWNGQKKIKLLDPNLLACKDRVEILQELIDSKAKIDFTQGLDARFINYEIAELLKQINVEMYHFAWDFTKNEDKIIKGLKIVKEIISPPKTKCYIYILTNYDTTFEQDIHRVDKVREIGFDPDVRIYRKDTAPKINKHLQRWCNNRIIYRSVDSFWDYVPNKKGSIREQFPDEYNNWLNKQS